MNALKKLILTAGLIGTISIANAQNNESFSVSTPDSSLEMKLVQFQNYNPLVSENKINLDDALLKKYFEQAVSYNQLGLIINNISWCGSGSGTANNYTIKDAKKLKKQIIRTVKILSENDSLITEMLPNGKRGMNSLNVKDALFLSGKIVAYNMVYDNLMLDSTSVGTIESQKVDSSSADELLDRGLGVCRNYARLNKVVFEFLKDRNKNLKNTYLTVYNPDDLSHALYLNHAWNRAVSISKTSTGQSIMITYVDPTFLDTRSLQKSEINAYNGFDEDHFLKGNIQAQKYLCNLLKVLGNRKIGAYTPKEYRVSSQMLNQYQHAAITAYINLAETSIQAGKSTEFTARAFYNASEIITSNVHTLDAELSSSDTQFSGTINKDDFEKYSEAYLNLKCLLGDDISSKVLSIDNVCSDANGDCVFLTRLISIAEMYTFVEKAYKSSNK